MLVACCLSSSAVEKLCSSRSLVRRDNSVDRSKSISRPAGAVEVGGTCGLFEGLALLESRALAQTLCTHLNKRQMTLLC
ncbi:hypothetical protein PSE10B_30900 [Pseudomonas amygdali pv. eriobotryae]|nr:hypothetical protein PSE10B_30900 [Pseudomonas amygdali pv. eriobotryae]GFZ70276.1 hypothetical protein PSE10C_10180 [Pseudomonas amygdali pv. eriobotryae]